MTELSLKIDVFYSEFPRLLKFLDPGLYTVVFLELFFN